jgi:hypothetical protein
LIPIAFLFVSPAFANDDEPEKREQLETAIPEGIRLLEAKEYELFLQSFVSPDELKDVTGGTSLAEFAKKFGERKAPRLLEVLKEIKDVKPVLDEAKAEATFAFKKEIGGKKSITFQKVDKYWYIKN